MTRQAPAFCKAHLFAMGAGRFDFPGGSALQASAHSQYQGVSQKCCCSESRAAAGYRDPKLPAGIALGLGLSGGAHPHSLRD